jgi:membrane protease YdiL (CAAX protease family)
MKKLLVYAALLIGLVDFLGLLTGWLDAGEKVLSSLLLVYLWYELGFSDLFFGKENKAQDAVLLAIFYVLSFKNVVFNFGWFLDKATVVAINYWTLAVGFVALNVFLLYVAWKKDFEQRGIVNSIIANLRRLPFLREVDYSNDFAQFVVLNVSLFGFFLFVFDPISQWLVASLDKSLFVIAIIYALHYSEALSKSQIAERINEFEDKVMSKLAAMFKSHKDFSLGIAALVVLFLLSEVGFFVVPLLTGNFDPTITALGPEKHVSLQQALGGDLTGDAFYDLSTVALYSLSITALVTLFLLPAVLLLKRLQKGEGVNIRSIAPALIAAFVTYLLVPVVQVEAITGLPILGVDVWVNSMSSLGVNSLAALSIVFIVFVVTWVMDRFLRFSETLVYLVSVMFFTDYFLKYFLSAIQYFVQPIGADPLISAIFADYVLVVVLFFVTALVVFIPLCLEELPSRKILSVLLMALFFCISFLFYPSFYATSLMGMIGPTVIVLACLIPWANAERLRGVGLFMSIVLTTLVIALIAGYLRLGFAPIVPNFALLFLAVLAYRPRLRAKAWMLPVAALVGAVIGWASFAAGEVSPFVTTSIALVLLFAAVTSVSEEFLFRGVLFDGLRKRFPGGIANALQALFFLGAHMNKFTGAEFAVVLFGSGLVFGWLRQKHGIWQAVVAHFVSNIVLLWLLAA